MQVRAEFVYGTETRVLEKDSSIFTFTYSTAAEFKMLHLVNRNPALGPILEGLIDDKTRLSEIKIFCDGVLMKHTKLSSVESAVYQNNVNELGELREYIEIQYQA